MCSGGSGEDRGPWGGKSPSDAKLKRKIGGYVSDKDRRGHDKGYGPRASKKETKRYWEGLFSRVRLPALRHVR